jgi:hypothetical protein
VFKDAVCRMTKPVPEPLGALPIAARVAQALESQGEDGAFHVELEAP